MDSLSQIAVQLPPDCYFQILNLLGVVCMIEFEILPIDLHQPTTNPMFGLVMLVPPKLQMDNALIDDRRIHVDFSQSVAKLWNQYRRKGQTGNGINSP